MARILIIDDDEYIRKELKNILVKNDFEAETAGSVVQAQEKINGNVGFDMYLVDIKLPDGDGFDIVKKLRDVSDVPVIFITSCDDEESISYGLDIGGDDYVVKPFRQAELLSRIRANLRRYTTNQEAVVITAGDVTVNINSRQVVYKGEEVSLSATEYELLRILVERKGAIVKRDDILERLWDKGADYVEYNTLNVVVSRLKSKLDVMCIETVRGIGYRFRI